MTSLRWLGVLGVGAIAAELAGGGVVGRLLGALAREGARLVL